LAEKIWIINESVSYFNEFRPLDCFVATLLATTVPKIVPYRGFINYLKLQLTSLKICSAITFRRFTELNYPNTDFKDCI
ncbi:hypothetical protein SC415_13185, partial [Legionella pneumophila serogroup 3]